jgi:hypothetical protein
MIAHFIVGSYEGFMMTICGRTISPRDISGSEVGVRSSANQCPDCIEKVNSAWVTFPPMLADS